MSQPILHQVCVGAAAGDAITDHALLLRRWLREMGFASEIYAEHIQPGLESEVRPASTYRPQGERLVIYHHSIGSPVVERLLALPVRLLLIYHNITPPEFFTTIDPVLSRQMILGRQQLAPLAAHTELALGVSAYNEVELKAAGFAVTGVLPLTLDEAAYSLPTNPAIAARMQHSGPHLLFVGRLVPNKRQEDLIKLLYFYRRVRPNARLILLGSEWLPAYGYWLRDLARDLGLHEAVTFTGYTSYQDMISYYRLADLYVSMSEHEGFGKPLIESMYLGLPILAYAACGVPDTLGDAGVLFHAKNYEALAELADMLIEQAPLRARIVARQQARAQAFLAPAVRGDWEKYVARALRSA